MKDKIIKLIDLKSIITLICTITLNVGFFKGMISTDIYIPFVTMTYMFYFQKKKEGE